MAPVDGVGRVTVSWIVAVLSVTPAPLARSVTGAVPSGMAATMVSVSTLVVVPLGSVAGSNLAETPVGMVSMESVTSPVKPPSRLTAMVTVPDAPVLTEIAVAEGRTSICGWTGWSTASSLHAANSTSSSVASAFLGISPERNFGRQSGHSGKEVDMDGAAGGETRRKHLPVGSSRTLGHPSGGIVVMGVDFGELTGFIVIAGSAAVLGLSYVAAYLMGKHAARKELDRREPFAATRPPDRLDRIEAAVDSIAVEVERLSEGQRFLLGSRGAERSTQPAAKPERRHATPV